MEDTLGQNRKRMWLLYDGRACGGVGTDRAICLVACISNRQAKRYRTWYGSCACYSYAEDGENLTDERWEWDFHPEGG